MRERKDFLAAARSVKAVTDGLILQARSRRDNDSSIRVGFTASRKVGGAVIRNRAKRRLRELARELIVSEGIPSTDYVLIARAGRTATHDFDLLRGDLRRALRKTGSALQEP